ILLHGRSGHLDWQLFGAAVLLIVIQVFFERNSRLARSSSDGVADGIRILEGGQLTDAILSSLKGFTGTFDVYNAEMNTLQNTKFWRTLCDCPGISQIRVALPPHVFKRLETFLTGRDPGQSGGANKDECRVFGDHTNKVRVLPVVLPPSRSVHAYALLNPAAGAEAPRTLFMFPKTEPFSALATQDHERWEHCSIIVDR